ncbi:hypothetical protein OK142_19765 [Agrobacterium sp. BT-220-3]|nr:hypothetical protein [Agrobacterium sp. BT-220-3]
MSDPERIQYKLMVPADLKEQLEEAAHGNRRSLSAEIIERLTFSVEHPPEHWEKLSRAVQTLESELDQAAAKYDALARHAEVMNAVSDQEFDYQLRLMYHVLNYVDDIPIDLAVWAFDMIATIERSEFMSYFYKNPELSEAEIREMIKARRENRRQEAMEAIKAHLATE